MAKHRLFDAKRAKHTHVRARYAPLGGEPYVYSVIYADIRIIPQKGLTTIPVLKGILFE